MSDVVARPYRDGSGAVVEGECSSSLEPTNVGTFGKYLRSAQGAAALQLQQVRCQLMHQGTKLKFQSFDAPGEAPDALQLLKDDFG